MAIDDRFRCRLVVDLAPLLAQPLQLVAWGVGPDGSVFACANSRREERLEKRGGASFPKSRWEHDAEYLLLRWSDGQTREVVLRDSLPIDHIQPLGDGLLIVGARCHWTRKGAETNAATVDWSGAVTRRLTLGDGINDVRTTTDGNVWVSYFDEGVFGNYGWGNPGPDPIGSSGLVAFSPDGKRVWEYDAAAAGTGSICDAYALNVAPSREVSVLFYTDFPIVSITNGSYRVWTQDSRGHALALARGRALVLGGSQRDAVRVLTLRNDGSTRIEAEGALCDDTGASLTKYAARGIGSKIFLLVDQRILVLDEW